MRVKKVPMNGYTSYLYKTRKYTTIHLAFLFEMEYSRENIYLCDLLKAYMYRTNAIYKTKRELTDKFRDFYNMDFTISNYNIGKKMFIEVLYNFFDPKLVQDEYLDEALVFGHSLLFKPRFENGKLDQETLEICKNNMIGSLASDLAEPRCKAKTGFIETVFPNSYISEDVIKTKEEYESLLNSFSDQKLIEFYHKIVDESFVGLAIMGNIESKHLEKIKDLFNFKSVRKIDRNYKAKIKINDKKAFVKTSDEEAKESLVYGVYNIKKYKQSKRFIYIIISKMLNHPGKIMHKILRDDLKIVYSSSSSVNYKAGYIVFNALIDKSNIDKCMHGFDKVIEKLKERKCIEELLPLVKKQININDYISDENKWNVFDDLFGYAFKTSISRKRANSIINNISEDDILNEIENLEKKVVYFYEGTKDEK